MSWVAPILGAHSTQVNFCRAAGSQTELEAKARKEEKGKKGALLVFAVLASLGAGLLSAEDNPVAGTWKLNVAKVKVRPGPAPKSQTRTVAAQRGGAEYSFEAVTAHRVDGTLNRGDKEIGTVTAEGRKSHNVKSEGTNPDGKAYTTEAVYDKQ